MGEDQVSRRTIEYLNDFNRSLLLFFADVLVHAASTHFQKEIDAIYPCAGVVFYIVIV